MIFYDGPLSFKEYDKLTRDNIQYDIKLKIGKLYVNGEYIPDEFTTN